MNFKCKKTQPFKNNKNTIVSIGAFNYYLIRFTKVCGFCSFSVKARFAIWFDNVYSVRVKKTGELSTWIKTFFTISR